MVRIPGFHCRGPGSVPGQGTEILAGRTAQAQKKKKKKKGQDMETTHLEIRRKKRASC